MSLAILIEMSNLSDPIAVSSLWAGPQNTRFPTGQIHLG